MTFDEVVDLSDLEALETDNALTELLLSECQLTEAAVAHLARCSTLTSLRILSMDIAGAAPSLFQSLQRCDSLKYIELSSCVLGSDAVVADVCSWLCASRSLEWLDVFENNFGLPSPDSERWHSLDLMRALGHCQSLTKLCLHVDGHLDDSQLAAFASGDSDATPLRLLSLLWCSVSQRTTLSAMFERLPLLESFEFSFPKRPLDFEFSASIGSMLASTSTLTALSLHGANFSVPAVLDDILEAVGSCSSLRCLTVQAPSYSQYLIPMPVSSAARLIDLVSNARLWRLRALDFSFFTLPPQFCDALVSALDESSHVTQLELTFHEQNGQPVSVALARNVLSQWRACHRRVSDIALGLASISLPAYVVLEIVDMDCEALWRARHGPKVAALILVKRAHDAAIQRQQQKQ